MKLSREACLREYWSSRRTHAIEQARLAATYRDALQRCSFVVVHDVIEAGVEVRIWVDEARRCGRELRRVGV